MGDCVRQPSSNNSVSTEVMGSIVDNWCWSNVVVNKFNFLWTISNFSYCHVKLGEVIKSPSFSSGENNNDQWCLRFCPIGPGRENRDYVSLFLLLDSTNKLEITAKFRLSFVNAKGEEVEGIYHNLNQRPFTFFAGKHWGFLKFMKRDYLFDNKNCLLPNDRLTIFCEVSVIKDIVSVCGKTDKLKLQVPRCRITDNLEELFLQQKLSDVVISTDVQDFPVHKAILAARSAVFSAMFEHKTEEGQNNHIIITDIESEAVGEMLRFIYCGKVKNLEKMAFDLLPAADKYNLKRLKIMCEQMLFKIMSNENVSEILVLADRHSADELKSMALKFMFAHATDIIHTAGWQSLMEHHPYLIVEAVKSLADI